MLVLYLNTRSSCFLQHPNLIFIHVLAFIGIYHYDSEPCRFNTAQTSQPLYRLLSYKSSKEWTKISSYPTAQRLSVPSPRPPMANLYKCALPLSYVLCLLGLCFIILLKQDETSAFSRIQVCRVGMLRRMWTASIPFYRPCSGQWRLNAGYCGIQFQQIIQLFIHIH